MASSKNLMATRTVWQYFEIEIARISHVLEPLIDEIRVDTAGQSRTLRWCDNTSVVLASWACLPASPRGSAAELVAGRRMRLVRGTISAARCRGEILHLDGSLRVLQRTTSYLCK